MARLSGRTVIVTGAGRGIGAVYATALAAEGARLVLCDLDAPTGTLEAVEKIGGEAIGQACDVTEAGALSRLVDAALARFERIDGLVNNAAIFASMRPRPFEEFDSAEFDRILQVNVRGTFEGIKAVLPAMKRQGYGKIVNIASGTVFKGTPLLLPYVSSKGAVIALTRAVAREVGAHGICVNCLAPGLTLSDSLLAKDDYPPEQIAGAAASRCLRRDQQPEDLTGTVGFLLAAESDFMTGQTLLVDGGSAMH